MLIYPDFYFDNVRDVKLDFLRKHNIKGLILDVDNTLIDFYKKFEDGTEQWVQELKNAGIKFCIVSNTNKFRYSILLFFKKTIKKGIYESKRRNGIECRKYCSNR